MEALSLTGGLIPRKENEISLTVQRERPRLLSFIQQRIPDREEAEDILQDVFYQFTEAYRTVKSIDRVTSWLFTVARNKITDRYRKKKPRSFSEQSASFTEGETSLRLEDMLSDLSSHPESELMRSVIWHAIEEALEEMPEDQREVFVMHEFEDRSFKEISAITDAPVNTLLSRKRYAVLFLRKRLQNLYDDLRD
ncbi:MAG: sigma-70 family RNA polymerase sigma factor [Tunicatimonas sp.]|uniref:RNA polymerase sigma factor n=1 Tax=Tunicatimonas sp. TaxID=1940096 RepID=UPI003C77B454